MSGAAGAAAQQGRRRASESGPAPAYDPSTDPGVIAWVTPGTNETFTMVGARRDVDTITSREGNGHVFTPVDANRFESVPAEPSFNGQPVLRNAGLALMFCPTLIVAPPFTMYISGSKTNAAQMEMCGAPNLTGIIQYKSSGDKWTGFVSGTATGIVTIVNTGQTYLGARAFRMVVKSGEHSFTSTGNYDAPEGVSANAIAGSLDGFYLGCYRVAGSRWSGDIGELVITTTMPGDE